MNDKQFDVKSGLDATKLSLNSTEVIHHKAYPGWFESGMKSNLSHCIYLPTFFRYESMKFGSFQVNSGVSLASSEEMSECY